MSLRQARRLRATMTDAERRLVVEADGGQHSENAGDERRTAWLASRGWQVVRFWNNDVLTNTDGVLETILQALQGE